MEIEQLKKENGKMVAKISFQIDIINKEIQAINGALKGARK